MGRSSKTERPSPASQPDQPTNTQHTMKRYVCSDGFVSKTLEADSIVTSAVEVVEVAE
jgi:hypothetical protein